MHFAPTTTSIGLTKRLARRLPARHYEPSLRVMPVRLKEPEYGDDFMVRRVVDSGRFLGMFSDAVPDSSCSSLYYQDNASKTELSLAEW